MSDTDNHGAILVTTLSIFWWSCNLLAYRYIQREAKPYRIFWWFSFLSLGSIGLVSSLELGGVIHQVNGATILALIIWASLFGGAGLLTWFWIVWKSYRQLEPLDQETGQDQATTPSQRLTHSQSCSEIKVVL